MERLDVGSFSFDALVAREWLVTNGLGGYASSTVCGTNTRKYHGLLVAAMLPPVRRMVLLSRVEETVYRDGASAPLAANEYPGLVFPRGHEFLRAFTVEPYPRWAYQGDGWTIQKTLRLLRGHNTVVLSYTLLGGDRSVELEVRPLLALRPIHELTYQWQGRLTTERTHSDRRHHRVPATARTPEVFFAHDGDFAPQPNWYLNTIYRREQERGYAGLEDLWNPGVVRFTLRPGVPVHFACSADPFELDKAVALAEAQDAAAMAAAMAAIDLPDVASLRYAASQFVATTDAPAAPVVLPMRFPWAAPSGRDALVAFAGIHLVTARFAQALAQLRALAAAERDGLMPTLYPEDGSPPRYDGADVSLWFANAAYDYLRYTSDDAAGRELAEVVLRVVARYEQGTALGVRPDGDGLLEVNAAGVAATWMDAKHNDWVVTPRTGRPVELNALWHNAVCVAAALAGRYDRRDEAARLRALAARVKDAFNRRFWNDAIGCCFDVIDGVGDDPAVRPNQLLAISLPFPVLAADRHATLLEAVRRELLTPFGPRTLSPQNAGYRGRYGGDVTARDAAYHNGPVFPWLLGHYVAALVKTSARSDAVRVEAEHLLDACLAHVRGPGVGQLSELFDGDAPNAPGGAPASAPSLAEVFRAYVEDVLDRRPELKPAFHPTGDRKTVRSH